MSAAHRPATERAGRAARSYRRRVADPTPPPRRDEVDHALRRRAVLRALHSGRTSATEVCDASPYLQRAAREWGARTSRPCPVCAREPVWEISWVYGDALGDGSGTARSARGVVLLARARPDFTVYEVEVCHGCGWNHLLRTYRTGPRHRPGTPVARAHPVRGGGPAAGRPRAASRAPDTGCVTLGR